MARLPQIALLLACTTGGVLVGRGTVEKPPDHRSPSDRSGPALSPPAVPALSSDLLRADIRRILKEELQFSRLPEPVQASVTAAPASPPPAPREAQVEAQAAAEQGRHIVQDALAARRWGDHDVLAIRQILPQMSSDDRDALLKELLPAINSGRVTLETVGEIF